MVRRRMTKVTSIPWDSGPGHLHHRNNFDPGITHCSRSHLPRLPDYWEGRLVRLHDSIRGRDLSFDFSGEFWVRRPHLVEPTMPFSPHWMLASTWNLNER